ncbi:hypothetical protein BT69DRAFT_1248487 [Atractiella rhizophila]|nr:hypothetical protein BT69DRAFT_1286366 [Atractiella rhizophila]KAH8917712.1 hypothetical protein BT69DRAFT_1248487 [Atractiella rhizophila]
MSELMKSFDETTKRQLEEFVERETARGKLQAQIREFTSLCWDKCITGTPGNRFGRGEETCLANCVDRFLDSSLHIMKRVEESHKSQPGTH